MPERGPNKSRCPEHGNLVGVFENSKEATVSGMWQARDQGEVTQFAHRRPCGPG